MNDLVLDGIVIPRGTEFAFNYVAAQTNRFRDWGQVSNMPQGEWTSLPQWERNTITARLRYLIRNNEYCAALATTFATHLGNSTLRSKATDKAYNDAKERLWLSWAGNCEVSGLSLSEVEDIIYTELLCAGEVFFLKLSTGQLQLIPAEWVFSGPDAPENEVQGIVYDDKGTALAYRIGTRDRRGQLQAGKGTVPASLVIHLYKRERVEQLRGVPWLAAATPAIQDIAEITAAKVMSVKAQSHLSAAIIKNGGGGQFPVLGDTGNTAGATATTGKPSRHATLKNGALIYLEPGEDIKTLSTAYQSQDFEAFLLSRLRAVGATIGMPIELFIEGYRDSNYSSARATNIVWGRKVRSIRALVERRFLQPVNLWVSERARAMGTLKGNRADDLESSFGFPSVPSIDEQKETEANVAKLAAGLTSYSAIYAENNLFWDDEIRTRARDARLIMEAAQAEGVDPAMLVPNLNLSAIPATVPTEPVNNLPPQQGV